MQQTTEKLIDQLIHDLELGTKNSVRNTTGELSVGNDFAAVLMRVVSRVHYVARFAIARLADAINRQALLSLVDFEDESLGVVSIMSATTSAALLVLITYRIERGVHASWNLV